MIFTGVATVTEHEPPHLKPSRPCSLYEQCVIQAGTTADYKRLCKYHYRDPRVPPAVHQVYVARWTGKLGVASPAQTKVVGVIVYAAPALNLGIRNKIFAERYKVGGGVVNNDVRSGRLNRELELIIRVVVHPAFRGIGLGVRLIKETLPMRPYRFIEMSAAMGAVNPFAEKAGMQAIPVPRPEATERVLAALRSIGLEETQMANPAEILRALSNSSPRQKALAEAELHRYALRWIKSRTKRKVTITTEQAAHRVANNALLAAMYYLWEHPKWSPPIQPV